MTAPQAATLLGVSLSTVQRWCRSGMIAATDRHGDGKRHRLWITGEALLVSLQRWYHIRSVMGLGRASRMIREMRKEHRHGD